MTTTLHLMTVKFTNEFNLYVYIASKGPALQKVNIEVGFPACKYRNWLTTRLIWAKKGLIAI